jgi:hypothetical protein
MYRDSYRWGLGFFLTCGILGRELGRERCTVAAGGAMEGAYAYVPTMAEKRADDAMLIWYYLNRFQHLSVAMRFLLAEAFFGRGPPRSPSGMVPKDWMDAVGVTDSQFKKAFRFQRIHIQELFNALEVPHEFHEVEHRIRMPGRLAVLALLHEVRPPCLPAPALLRLPVCWVPLLACMWPRACERV